MMEPSTPLDFATFWALFGPAVIASVVAAVLCGFLGFFVIVRRIAFVSSALGQISGLGVALGFLVGSLLGLDPHTATPLYLDPVVIALLLTGAAALGMALVSTSQRNPPESMVAWTYLVATALAIVVLGSPRLALEKHEVEMLLFGNTVAVTTEHLEELIAVAVLVLISQMLLFKDYLLVSFDPEMARTLGLPVRTLELALHGSIGLSVAVATRAIGALPVFGFLVLPAAAAFVMSQSVRGVLVLSIAGAALAAGLGFYISYLGDWATGPTMVVTAAAYWPIAAAIMWVRRRLAAVPREAAG